MRGYWTLINAHIGYGKWVHFAYLRKLSFAKTRTHGMQPYLSLDRVHLLVMDNGAMRPNTGDRVETQGDEVFLMTGTKIKNTCKTSIHSDVPFFFPLKKKRKKKNLAQNNKHSISKILTVSQLSHFPDVISVSNSVHIYIYMRIHSIFGHFICSWRLLFRRLGGLT